MRTSTLIAIAIISMLATSTASAWTFHGDEQRTGNFTAINGSDLLWKLNLTTNYIECSPVVSDGFVYVMTVPSMGGGGELGLYKINAKNGSIVGKLTGEFYGRTTPTIYGDMIFVHAVNSSNGESWLYCIYADNLTIKWSQPVNPHVDGWWHVDSHPLVYNNTVYVLSYYDGVLYAFDFDGNKKIVWNNSTLSPPYTVSPYTSPSAYNGLILFAGQENGQHELICIYENNRSVKWKYPVDGAIVSAPAVDYGYAYFVTTNFTNGVCRLYAVNVSDPYNRSWSVTIPGIKGVWRLTPAVGNGYVVVGSRGDTGWSLDSNDSVICYHALGDDHEPVWVFNKTRGLNGDVGGSPIIAGNYVLFTTNTQNGKLYALYIENGSIAWYYDLKQWCLSSPFVWNGKVYVGADNGNLYCFGNFSTIWEGEVSLYPENVNVTLSDGSQANVSGISAFYALISASNKGNFSVEAVNQSYGIYVKSIAGIEPDSYYCGWLYWVNYPDKPLPGVYSDKYLLKDNDTLLWFYGCYYYDPNEGWKTTTPADSKYVVKIKVHVKFAKVTNLTVSNAKLGGNATAYVNVTTYKDGWYVVVVSGLNDKGDYIAGISTFHLNAGETLRVPVLIHIPQRNTAGTYKLFAGVYELSGYPNDLIAWSGGVDCNVS
jgi:outer membrane protein assembly factor BamB